MDVPYIHPSIETCLLQQRVVSQLTQVGEVFSLLHLGGGGSKYVFYVDSNEQFFFIILWLELLQPMR